MKFFMSLGVMQVLTKNELHCFLICKRPSN